MRIFHALQFNSRRLYKLAFKKVPRSIPDTLIWPLMNQRNCPVVISHSETRSKSRIHRRRERARVPQKTSV